jgi:predicted nucleic acid-binding protein
MKYLLDTNTVSELTAIALSHQLAVATHNPDDFFEVATVDPWLHDQSAKR